MKIRLLNRQRALRVRLPAVRRLIQALAHRAFPAEAPFAELAVVLTDDAAMPAYKAGCFGFRAQTDVVTQAYAAVPGVCAATAELVVNAERARAEGRRRPGGPARELALYLAHGLDHLAGADDDTPARRRAMRRRETAWLDADPAAWKGIAPR
ncbi:MAG TPA: rRNA maturation RNAse YbeY [Kiritimatiellia bacterium]|nr:rRNA maturation RNAse YbeY [Kiritimatiellia bacterium]